MGLGSFGFEDQNVQEQEQEVELNPLLDHAAAQLVISMINRLINSDLPHLVPEVSLRQRII